MTSARILRSCSTLLALALAGCCGILGGNSCSNGPPPPDSCSGERAGSFTSFEIGADDDLFRAYHDGDQAHVVVGGQGSTMMGLRFRMMGGDVPACLAQKTHYQDPSQDRNLGVSSSQVKTHAQPDGSFLTKPLWIPGSLYGDFDIITEAGGQTWHVSVSVNSHDSGP